MLRYRATSGGQWESIIRKEFSHCELRGLEQDFTGDIDVLTLPGGIWFGDLTSGTFEVVHDPQGRFRPTRDEFMVVIHRNGATGQLRHRGRQLAVVRGGAVTVDLEKPYHFGYSSSLDQTVLKFPRHLVSAACFDNAGVARRLDASSSTRLLSTTLDELRITGAALELAEQTNDSRSQTALRREMEMMSMTLRDLVSYSFGGDRRIVLQRDPRAQMQLAKDFLEANYWNSAIHADDVAQALRVSTRRLSKIFEAAGTSPAAFLRDLRLDRAVALMDASEDRLSVTDLAYRVGFGDISTFGRAFKKRFGCTPAEYRSMHGTSASSEWARAAS